MHPNILTLIFKFKVSNLYFVIPLHNSPSCARIYIILQYYVLNKTHVEKYIYLIKPYNNCRKLKIVIIINKRIKIKLFYYIICSFSSNIEVNIKFMKTIKLRFI